MLQWLWDGVLFILMLSLWVLEIYRERSWTGALWKFIIMLSSPGWDIHLSFSSSHSRHWEALTWKVSMPLGELSHIITAREAWWRIFQAFVKCHTQDQVIQQLGSAVHGSHQERHAHSLTCFRMSSFVVFLIGWLGMCTGLCDWDSSVTPYTD